MDGHGLAENDPYKELLENAKKARTPGFLGGTGGGETPVGKKAAAGLGAAEKAAGKVAAPIKAVNALNDARQREAEGGGLFSGSGRENDSKKKSAFKKLKIAKIAAAVSIVGLTIGVGVVMVGVPTYLIGNLDYNLQDALGFSGTVAVLEEQAEYVTDEQLSNGEVPEGYANDLAAAGIQVGQVTMAGDFVPTNRYIANIEELNEIAAIGSGYRANGSEGELAVLFDGNLVEAGDFVAAVESNPKMYAAFSEAANISAKFYYSDNVNKIFDSMGLKRYAFHNWEATGDSEQDQKNYEEIMKSILDGESSVAGAGDCDDAGGCGTEITFTKNDASDIISDAKSLSGGSAAQLLNSAVSSEEPYRAAAAFMAIEEPIQRTRIDGDGPANEVMTTLNKKLTIAYTDVETGETVKKRSSIIETPNFVAAVADGEFSSNEALNFSRDRVLKATGADDNWVIGHTAVSSDARKKSDMAVGASVGSTKLDNARSSLSIAISESNSDLFTSIVGGNRVVEGGSFLSNTINLRALGAMPSDEQTVAEYSKEVDTVLARKAEAERATKSPFDISSPYTFMGGIVRGFANTMVKNNMIGKGSLVSTMGAAVDFAGDSVNGIFGGAVADGIGHSYLDTFGQNCDTVNSVNSAGDIYCTQITTIHTGDMKKTKKDWEKEINKEDYKNDFVLLAMDRWSTFGVKDVGVCRKYNETHGNIIGDIASFFGMYSECLGVGGAATGEDFVMGKGKTEKYSAYTLYDTVSSLLSDKKSSAEVFLEDYYAAHPEDDSKAGLIARRSGMSKEEAEVALAYADYLTEIARYNASERYVFGAMFEAPGQKNVLVEHSSKINGDLYCFWRGQIEYGTQRDRNFA